MADSTAYNVPRSLTVTTRRVKTHMALSWPGRRTPPRVQTARMIRLFVKGKEIPRTLKDSEARGLTRRFGPRKRHYGDSKVTPVLVSTGAPM
jgi:hypothetical protein